MSIATKPITAEEFLAWPDDGLRHELIRGEVISMALPGGRHGKISLKIGRLIGDFVEANQLGDAYVETGFLIERNPDTVRGPDVAFVRAEQLARVTNPEKYPPFAPDLAVEVVSPNDRPKEVEEKAKAWLAAGSREVWVDDPVVRTVTIYRPSAKPSILSETQSIDGGTLLPGFTCLVSQFFL
jgi:Uma2 family endonuclease